MTLVSPPPALPQIKQVTKLMSHLQVSPEVIWMVPLGGSYMIMVTHWACPVPLFPQDFLREPLLSMVPLTSSRIIQGVRFYSQKITYLCIHALLTSEEITPVSFSSFLFVLWRIFLGWGFKTPPWQWHFQSLLLGTLAGEGVQELSVVLFLLSLSWGRF